MRRGRTSATVGKAVADRGRQRGCDSAGQVISGRKYWADGSLVAGQQFDYGFDDIGNRKTTGGRESAVSSYTVNRLNQYSQRTVSSKVDVLGIANPTAGVTVGVSGGTAYTASRKGEYYHYPLTVGNSVYPTIEAKSLYGATETKSGEVFNPPATETFAHDLDGNLTSDGRWTYVWDGENRLIEMKRDTSTPTLSSRLRMTFEYDHQGRRIRKIFYTHNGSSWVESTDTVFLYDGWNLMGELNANASNAKVRTYLWGLDLSGTEHGAGGVGGLLKVTDYTSGTTHHFAAYDGNGNVAALVDGTSGTITARYEYGPFGEPLRSTGNVGEKNPIRFSSKYTDAHSGLLYYGYRYYNPVTGRWVNMDPIGEQGGRNLYKFNRNGPMTLYDPLGQSPCLFEPTRGGCIEFANNCTQAQMSDFMLIPEEGTNLEGAERGRTYCDLDGFWFRPVTDKWYKVPDHCSLKVNCDPFGGKEHETISCCNELCSIIQRLRGRPDSAGFVEDKGKTRHRTNYPW